MMANVFEGFGDEVLQCAVTFSAGCLLLWVLVMYVRSRPSNLHPDSVEQVAAVRRGRRGIVGANNNTSDVSGSGQSGGSPGSVGTGSGVDSRCPVCLDPRMEHGVVTNCGHTFCAHCILQYWRLDQWPHPARCPVCRRQVRLELLNLLFIRLRKTGTI